MVRMDVRILRLLAQVPNGPEKHLEIFKDNCRRAMKAGFAGRLYKIWLHNFLCDRQVFTHLLQALALEIASIEMSLQDSSHVLIITVKLPERQQMDPLVEDTFIAELVQIGNECETGPEKHKKVLMNLCKVAMTQGYGGHKRKFLLEMFLCDPEEFRDLVKPLEVESWEWCTGFNDRPDLLIIVKLPNARAETQGSQDETFKKADFTDAVSIDALQTEARAPISIQEHYKKVESECRSGMQRGFAGRTKVIHIWHFLCDRQPFLDLVPLVVVEAELQDHYYGKILRIKVELPEIRPQQPQERGEMDPKPTSDFVLELIKIGSECDHGPTKHTERFDQSCKYAMKEGYAGHTYRVILVDFFCSVEEFLPAVEPLEVVKAEIFDGEDCRALFITVKMPQIWDVNCGCCALQAFQTWQCAVAETEIRAAETEDRGQEASIIDEGDLADVEGEMVGETEDESQTASEGEMASASNGLASVLYQAVAAPLAGCADVLNTFSTFWTRSLWQTETTYSIDVHVGKLCGGAPGHALRLLKKDRRFSHLGHAGSLGLIWNPDGKTLHWCSSVEQQLKHALGQHSLVVSGDRALQTVQQDPLDRALRSAGKTTVKFVTHSITLPMTAFEEVGHPFLKVGLDRHTANHKGSRSVPAGR